MSRKLWLPQNHSNEIGECIKPTYFGGREVRPQVPSDSEKGVFSRGNKKQVQPVLFHTVTQSGSSAATSFPAERSGKLTTGISAAELFAIG